MTRKMTTKPLPLTAQPLSDAPLSDRPLRGWMRLVALGSVGWLVGCATSLPPEAPYSEDDMQALLRPYLLPNAPKIDPAPADLPPARRVITQPQPSLKPPLASPANTLVSQATNPKEYRKDGARHIYQLNSHRIYKGPMPPLMQAVGVLEIELDASGQVRQLNWMRPPDHVPDVMKEIERTVLAAAPFPAAVRMGAVKYTDVWLWDKSGRFQLDTLTEGQLQN